MDFKAKEIILIPEGNYQGTLGIMKVETFPESGYEYAKFPVTVVYKEIEQILSLGFPARITLDDKQNPSSQLAHFLKTMGCVMEKGKDYEEDIKNLDLRQISFVVKHKTTKNGVFANIAKDSVLAHK